MAEKAIRLGGESTADAIVSAVDTMYSEHTFNEKDFVLKHNDAEIAMDTNFAAQSFWKDVRVRFFRKKSAVLGLILVVFIVLLAAFGPGMNEYTLSLIHICSGPVRSRKTAPSSRSSACRCRLT